MPSIARLAYWEGVILLCGFFGVVLWKLFTGGIGLSGLLDGDEADGATLTTSFSPGRAQLLVFTVLSALYFLLQVLRNPGAFPNVPPALLVALGGSQAAYLGGKAYSLLYRGGANNPRRRRKE